MSIFRKKHEAVNIKRNRRISAAPKSIAPEKPDKKVKPKSKKKDKKPVQNRRRNTAPPEPPEKNILEPEGKDKPAERKGSYAVIGRYILKTALFAAMIAGFIYTGKLIYIYGTTSSRFAVKYIEIQGNDRLTNKEILDSANFGTGDNIFLLDLVKLQKRIEENPWVVKASVVQRLPSTIIIEVVEREVEMMVLFDVPYIVDNSGEIFKRWLAGDPLPRVILTGISKRELYEDEKDVEKILLDGVALKNLYKNMGVERLAPLIEIHREPDGDFSLTAGRDPFYVRLGSPPYRKKLTRLKKLLKKMAKSDKSPAIVYFDNRKRPDRITVKLKNVTIPKKMNKKMPKI